MWKALVPWDVNGVKKYDSQGKQNKGARIQVVPRVSVAYDLEDYERIRKDNITLLEAEGGGIWSHDTVDWKAWPPKLVAKYPYARWDQESWEPPF